MSEKIGFIGLGNLGLPVAANLLNAGYDSECIIGRGVKRKHWLPKGRNSRHGQLTLWQAGELL